MEKNIKMISGRGEMLDNTTIKQLNMCVTEKTNEMTCSIRLRGIDMPDGITIHTAGQLCMRMDILVSGIFLVVFSLSSVV